MDRLKTERDQLTTRSFYVMFETLFIFGVPAFLGVLLGRWIMGEFETGQWVLYSILGATFILSWIIFLARVRNISKNIKHVQDRIKEARESEND